MTINSTGGGGSGNSFRNTNSLAAGVVSTNNAGEVVIGTDTSSLATRITLTNTVAATNIAERFFTFTQMGDCHLPITDGVLIGSSAQSEADYTNSMNYIIANKTAWRTVGHIQAGDNVDINNGTNGWLMLTNEMGRLLANGISPVLCPGNHETGGANTNYDFFVGTMNSNNPAFSGVVYSGLPGSTRNAVFVFTNGATRLAFIACNNPQANAAAWITEAAQTFSNYQCAVIIHKHVASYGAYDSTLGAAQREAIRMQPNIFAVISGHYREPWNYAHSYDVGYAGNTIAQIYWNNQSMTNGGNNYIRRYTVYPERGIVVASTIEMTNSTSGVVITNGQASYFGSQVNCSNGYYANFTFPLKGMGYPQQITGLARKLVNPSFNETNGANTITGMTNAFWDTLTPLGRQIDSSGETVDAWGLGRSKDSSNLFVLYASTAIDGEMKADNPAWWRPIAQITPSGQWAGDTASNAVLQAQISAFVAPDTNFVTMRGAGGGTNFNRTFAWNAAANSLTNAQTTRVLTNIGGMWRLQTAAAGTASYSNSTLFGQWVVGSGTSPAPYAETPVWPGRLADTNTATGEFFLERTATGDLVWTNAFTGNGSSLTNLSASSLASGTVSDLVLTNQTHTNLTLVSAIGINTTLASPTISGAMTNSASVTNSGFVAFSGHVRAYGNVAIDGTLTNQTINGQSFVSLAVGGTQKFAVGGSVAQLNQTMEPQSDNAAALGSTSKRFTSVFSFGYYAPSNTLTMANVVANITNSGGWVGMISNCLMSVTMSNNVATWKQLNP